MTTFNPNGSNPTSTAVKPATMAQISWYMDLCKQKKVAPQNINGFTYEQMSDAIGALRAIYPVSDAQIKLINELLQQAGMEVPSEDFFEKLTGGRDGSASRAINQLQQIVAERTPPNEYQMDILFRMFYCPDVKWDNYGITVKVMLGDTVMKPKKNGVNYVVNEDGSIAMEEVELWRWVTGEEFTNQIITTLNKQGASKLIDECRNDFETWRNTRASKATIDMIRQLENRMSNIFVPREKGEVAVDIEGNIIDDNLGGTVSEATKASRYSPVAYEPLSEAALYQFTQKEAETYLNRLRDEYARGQRVGMNAVTPDERRHGLINYTPNDMDTVEELAKQASDKKTLNAKEWERLNNILFALCAASGEEDIELINSGFYIFSENTDGESIEQEKRNYIRAYMVNCIEQGYVSMDGMLTMIDRSNVAKEILFGINKAGKFVRTQSLVEIRDEKKRQRMIHGDAKMPTYNECK